MNKTNYVKENKTIVKCLLMNDILKKKYTRIIEQDELRKGKKGLNCVLMNVLLKINHETNGEDEIR